mgnify:CR=1 FL=1
MIKQTVTTLILLALIFVNPLSAQLSPGPLAQVHEHLSGLTNCLNCHTWGSKDLSPKCLDCHTPIRNRVESKSGFHGQMDGEACQSCHTDHMKREFKMVHWEPSQSEFDHLKTGYELKGKHQELDCEKCHTDKFIKAEDVLDYAKSVKSGDVLTSTFLGLGSSCASCHEDVHRNEFKEQSCEDCHNELDWQAVKQSFDHDVRTKFSLRGAHSKLECEKCHTKQQVAVGKFQVQQFSGLIFDLCVDCHEDEHKGSFGNNCLKCHTERSFKIADQTGAFNHNATRYPLIGKHTLVKCKTCHTSENKFKAATSFDLCSDCHEDYHKGAFAQSNRDESCDACHSVRGFFPALFGVMEHTKTRFALNGSHLAQPCVFCHSKNNEPIYRWNPLNCESCHTTPHGEQFQRYRQNQEWCEACHVTREWESLTFDHGATFFPLIGKHTDVNCASCHKTEASIVQYEDVDTECVACHIDVHAKQFPDRGCNDCHTNLAWTIEPFKHDLLTEFPLDGQHKDVSCGQCHKFEGSLNTIRFKPIAHQCQDCHSFGDFKR